MSGRGGRQVWLSQIYVLMLPFQIAVWIGYVWHVLSGGVLSIVRINGTVRRIPLGVTDIRRTMIGFQLRWPEGKRTRSVTTSLSAGLIDVVKQAAQVARAAPPGSLPATEAEAAQTVTFGFHAPSNNTAQFMVILPLVALLFVAVWLNQPLILLPGALLPVVAERMPQGHLLMLSGEQLWILRRAEAPHRIPLTTVRTMSHGTQTTLITTSDPGWPEIRLNRYQSSELLKYLKRRMQGEPNPPPQPAPAQAADPAAPPLRCSLCGRPLAGATADGTAHICDMCAERTRVDAVQGGHGLAGRDPKPM